MKLNKLCRTILIAMISGATLLGEAAYISAAEVPETSVQTDITFTRSITKITAGKSYIFMADTGNPTEFVKWSVDKSSYASISATGKLKAKRAGKVAVTASTDICSKKIQVTINPKKIIAIDAGHQAKGDSSTEPVGPGSSTKKAKVSSGTSGVSTGVPEYKLTLSVANKLKTELVDRGYKVIMIRTKNNVSISNKERAQKANKNSDICIRLHADGSTASSVSGASALFPSSSNKYVGSLSKSSKKLSSCVINNMCNAAGNRNRGMSVRDDLTGTNWSTIPVTLIEMGFMTNPAEDRKMQDKGYQEKLASGMADGIDEYFE